MKKTLTVVLILCLIFTMSACNTPVPVQEPQAPAEPAEEPASAPEKSQPEEPEVKYPVVEQFPASIDEFEWEDYLAHMQQLKGLSESDLRSLNNMGFSRQNIMDMTPEEAQEHLEGWRKAAEERNRRWTASYLKNWENAITDEQFVYTDGNSTARLEMMEEWFAAVENNDTSIIWCMASPEGINTIYYLVKTAEEFTLSTYWLEGDEAQERVAAITQTLETEDSFQITDETGFTLFVPKTAAGQQLTVPAVIYPLGDALGIHAGQVKEFKYEVMGVNEGKELTLQDTDAANAAIGLLSSKVTPQEGREMNPIVGGEFTRYTLTLLDGSIIVIEDNGMISVKEKKNLYCWESKKEVKLPEDAVWNTYTIDPFGGEENPVT